MRAWWRIYFIVYIDVSESFAQINNILLFTHNFGAFQTIDIYNITIGQQRLFIEIYRSVGKRQLSNVDDHMGHVPSTISLPSTTQQHDGLNQSKCSYCG